MSLDNLRWLGKKETPVPIPNTAVKLLRADDTARATVWESRSPPQFFFGQSRSFLSETAFSSLENPSAALRKKLFKKFLTQC